MAARMEDACVEALHSQVGAELALMEEEETVQTLTNQNVNPVTIKNYFHQYKHTAFLVNVHVSCKMFFRLLLWPIIFAFFNASHRHKDT